MNEAPIMQLPPSAPGTSVSVVPCGLPGTDSQYATAAYDPPEFSRTIPAMVAPTNWPAAKSKMGQSQMASEGASEKAYES